MSCSNCFEVDLKQCPSTIELMAGLTATTDYFWVIQKNSRIYQKKVTTASDGKLVIDTTDLPAGLLNAYAGAFILEIRDGSNYPTIITLTGGYTCIVMRFVDVEGDPGVNNLINVAA
jgi:hypothetical protein